MVKTKIEFLKYQKTYQIVVYNSDLHSKTK